MVTEYFKVHPKTRKTLTTILILTVPIWFIPALVLAILLLVFTKMWGGIDNMLKGEVPKEDGW